MNVKDLTAKPILLILWLPVMLVLTIIGFGAILLSKCYWKNGEIKYEELSYLNKYLK